MLLWKCEQFVKHVMLCGWTRNHVFICYVHWDVLSELSCQDIAKEFVRSNDARWRVFDKISILSRCTCPTSALLRRTLGYAGGRMTVAYSELRAGLKGTGARGNFHWRAPMTYFMTSSFVRFVFADSQCFCLLFPVVDYVPAVVTRFLAPFDCKPHEIVLKINVSCLWL